MKRFNLLALAFAIFFLFLIQMLGSLIRAIYVLDLLKTSLDEKALGLLFLFSPLLLLLAPRRPSAPLFWVLFGLLIVARGLTPYLNTSGRMLAAGVGTGAASLLLPLLLSADWPESKRAAHGLAASLGMALAVMLSIFLRTVDYSLDYSLQPEGGWVGWGLGIALGVLVAKLGRVEARGEQGNTRAATPAILGMYMVIGLMYFAFSAPAVIARWTEGDYRLIVGAVSLLTAIWMTATMRRPEWSERITGKGLMLWNALFTLSLSLTILAHRVPFPPTPDSPPIVIGPPSWVQQIPLAVTLLLFPVLFLDLRILWERVRQAGLSPRALVPGMMLGNLALILMVFAQIFSNVWGYVEPVSPWFRNKFCLPYLLMAGLVTLIVGGRAIPTTKQQGVPGKPSIRGWLTALSILFTATVVAAILTTRVRAFAPRDHTLVVMTYNIQQANDVFGEASHDRQLALMEKISPDIIALQESDSVRISLNNVDLVRYYAGKLGYHAYYGPRTVTGTFGTAILSKFPLENTRSVFTFSDQDEIGIAVAEVHVGGQRFTIYNVHPDGSDTAMLVFAQTLLDLIDSKDHVIALGDYNLRPYEQPYQMIAAKLTNAWESARETASGETISEEDRIDHIFLSPSFTVLDATYLLPPDSATDHPVHWATIGW